MASRLIHYLIAEEIAVINTGIDRDRFVYGALLPDLSKHEDGSYEKAHFGEVLTKKNKKGINWLKFKDKYNWQMSDSLYMGYYCHLIMDALWFSSIADKFIRIHPYPERKLYYKMSYTDFRVLNYILSKDYNLHYHLPLMEGTGIEEIDLSLYLEFCQALRREINDSKAASREDLELYPYNEILTYINQAKELCINELSALAAGKESMNPVNLYTTV